VLSVSTLVVFSLAALGLLVVPGPAVLYIVTRSAAQGRKAGLASVLGIELATLCHSVAAAFGLSAILMASATAFTMVKYVGAAYLVYLGIRTILAKRDVEAKDVSKPRSMAELFRKGFVVNLLNPKTALFFYAFLPQFADAKHGLTMVQILILGAVFVVLATCTDGLYAFVASGVGRFLTRKKSFQRIQKYVTGWIYITLGLAAAVSGTAKK